MSDLKERAKRLIEKGRAVGDNDLVEMGMEMLETYAATETNSGMPVKPQKAPVRVAGDITDQFRVNNRSLLDSKKGRKIQVPAGQRINKFVDNGTEAAELKGKTPPSQPKTKRKNPLSSINCTICGKTEKVIKSLIQTEAYRCERCLSKIIGGK